MIRRIVADLRSFKRRRIDIPVGTQARVLDVGSGDKPHWRADVLLDRFIGAEHSAQRSGGASALVSRPLFDADAAAMPFRDQAFDYVVCSHVLEHVTDPAGVMDELMRVGRAGYIEVPEASSAKIVDFPSHLWWVRLDRASNSLVFTPKSTPYFDREIDNFLNASGLRQTVADVLDRHLDHRIIEHRWVGRIDYRIEGPVSAALVGELSQAAGSHRNTDKAIAKALTAILTMPKRWRRRRPPILLSDIVRADLSPRPERLEQRVYRL